MRKYKKYNLSCGVLVFLAMIVCFGFASADGAETQSREARTLFQNPLSLLTSETQECLPADAPARKDPNAAEGNDETNVEEERELMENALDILEVADNYWQKGDIENTLNELDKAYALLLDTDGDVEIARQKDDLRLLISQRIIAVYSSKKGPINGKASEIQLIMNADVEKEIRSFQGPEKEFFTSSYLRSGLYRELILDELKKAGIPEELFWLPLVESGFKVSAYSSARALGLWQFIPSTGYKFGLSRDEWVDERMDVLKSTRAAIAYLKELHAMFGDWLTVLAAYNCGEGRVLRVISSQHINYFDRFWDLYSRLPHETARYVPRFLATLHIVRNPAKYGFELQTTTDTMMNCETVKVDKMMRLSDVASRMEASEDYINVLNAELRHKITPDREYDFKVPEGSLQKFQLVYNDIPIAEKPHLSYEYRSKSTGSSRYIQHRVRPGETVASIAKRYRVSRQSIYSCNRINRNKRLSQQMKYVRIPIYSAETAAKQKTTGSTKTYKVRKGDTLFGIARSFNVSVVKLKQANRLTTNEIKYGTMLKIPMR